MPYHNYWFCSVFFLWLLGLPISHPICAPQLDVTKFQCTHSRLIEVPGNINRLTEELDLSHNLIEVLHEDSFHRLNSLRRLVLSHNKIYKITERAFLAVAQTLTYLDLRNNQIMSNSITGFPITALAPLVHLTYLDLSGNPLSIVPTEFLRHMGANLTQLDLSSVPMKLQIQPGAFRGLAQLHRLNLAGNSFGEFNEDSFEGLRPAQFSQLSLHGVQWRCDCRLLWFRRWLNHVPRKALFADALPGGECISPPAFKGRSLLFLNLTDLQCAPRLLGTIPPSQELDSPEPVHVVALDGYNLTLSCVFVSEPKMQVHWYQNGILIQSHWKRFTQFTSSGTKFTTSLHFHQLNSQLDTGTYQCQTSNQKGSAGKNFMVDVKTQLSPEKYEIRMHTSGQTEKPFMQAQDLGKYLIILGIIAASNIVFFIVGAITYKCIKCRHRVRRKPSSSDSQVAYILGNGHSHPLIMNHTEQTEIHPNSRIPLLPHTPGIQPVSNTSISHPVTSFHPVHYDYHLSDWQAGTILTTTTTTTTTNASQIWTEPDVRMPTAHRNPIWSNQAAVGEHFPQDLTHILSPHRTKRMRQFGEPPSPISSDMGYSASTSSRTVDRSDPSAERTQTMHKSGQPESASKPCDHYTLTLKQNDGNKTELVYEPRGIGSKKGRNTLRISAPSMRETSLAPQPLLSSQLHSRETRMTEHDETVHVIPESNRNKELETLDEDRDPLCPIHGTDPQHTCVIHAKIEDLICPVHGSLLDTSGIEKNVEQLCALNEKYRSLGTRTTVSKPYLDNNQRFSNPNLTSINGEYLGLSDSQIKRSWKSVQRNNTLPR